MEGKYGLKEIDIINRTCYYFDDMMRVWDRDIDFNDILLDEILYEEKYKNVLIYDISYKTSAGAKPLSIRFDKINGFIKIYDGIRYLVLFDYGWCDKICNRIRSLISEKSGIADSINHNFARIRINSYNSLPVEKILTFHSKLLIRSC